MQPADFRAPSADDIVVKLRRLGQHFDVLSGLGAGPSFEDVAATCHAGADEVERLREENGDWAERHKELLADIEAMNKTRLRQGEAPIPTDELPDDHPLGRRQ